MDGETFRLWLLLSSFWANVDCNVIPPPLNSSLVSQRVSSPAHYSNRTRGIDNRFVRIGSPHQSGYIGVPTIALHPNIPWPVSPVGSTRTQAKNKGVVARAPPGFIEDIDGILGIKRREVRFGSDESLQAIPDARPDAPSKSVNVDTHAIGFGRNVAVEGLRVVRGPNWRWDEQDGGSGSIGIIMGDIQNGWCTVQWPSGYTNGYRVGSAGQYDLRIAPEVPTLLPEPKVSNSPSDPSKLRSKLPLNPVIPAYKAEQSPKKYGSSEVNSHGSAGSKPDPQLVGISANNPARKGLQVERGPHWQWGDQDGGIGSLGVIVGDIKQGWCTVQWPSGYSNGYRIGHAGQYDLRIARRGMHSSSRTNSRRSDASSPLHTRQAQPERPGTVVSSALVRPGLKVQRGADWQWRDQDGGIGSVGVVQGVESRGWVRVKWPSGIENGYRVGDGGKFDLLVAGSDSMMSRHHQKEVERRRVQQARHHGQMHAQGCNAKPRARCWCIDQYGDVLHLP